MSVNAVTLVGNVGNAPELRSAAGGKSVASFSLATHDNFVDSAGNRQQRTEWHRIVVWGKQADTVHRHLAKGRLVAVQGKLCYRTWKDAEGTQRTTAEVVASQVRFLGAASGGEGASPAAQSRAPAGNADYQAEPEPFSDDDIPF